jgi:hypothetical protein
VKKVVGLADYIYLQTGIRRSFIKVSLHEKHMDNGIQTFLQGGPFT